MITEASEFRRARTVTFPFVFKDITDLVPDSNMRAEMIRIELGFTLENPSTKRIIDILSESRKPRGLDDNEKDKVIVTVDSIDTRCGKGHGLDVVVLG
jgi:hypothetical protein